MDSLILLLAALGAAGAVTGLLLLRQGPSGRTARLILAMEERAGHPARSNPSLLGRWLGRLHRFMPAAKLAEFEVLLKQAGRPHGLDAGQFISLKLALAALSVALAALFAAPVPLLALFALEGTTLGVMALLGLAAFVAPDVWLNGLVARRQQQASAELPLFTDLVATAVSAGLPLPEAVRRVAATLPGLVAREFLRAVQEMAAAKPRTAAWRDLVDRVPGEEFRTIVQAIMQAEQHGTSVAEMLRYQVRQLRALKLAEAQRTAQAASVKMRIPMLLLILLPFMVLLLGPALIQVGELLL
ncbi:MAG: type II secretion system F family protein [Bacillota bacterium]